MHRLELRAGLDRELVERQMIRRQRQRLAQFRPPGGRASGPAAHRSGRTRCAETSPARSPARRSPAPPNAAGRASAAPPASRLCTPIETRFTPASRNAAKRAASTLVGLASSVISMSSAGVEQPPRIVDQRGDRLRLHQARRAAAEEDRGQPPAPEPRRLPRQLPAQRGAEARLRDALPHMRVEVAVRALGQAERPVDIERERFHCREI